MVHASSVIEEASHYAQKALRSCSIDGGIIAGRHHFVDYWARDSLFASLGAHAVCEYEVGRATIETFIKYQRIDGLVPYRVSRSLVTLRKYFGKPPTSSSL